MAGRAALRRGKRSGGTLSGILFLLACLVVLALTFTLGMLVGRQWARRTTATLAPAADRQVGGDAAGSEARTRVRKLSERDRDDSTPQIQGKLTFYHTLTAPLTAGPPPPPKRPASGTPKPGATPPKPDPEPEPAHPLARPDAAADTVYTVQVAAFKSRGQADRLRDKLGDEAYVSEGGSTTARFRVRVGFYPGRAEAEAAAARLKAEHAVTGFITRSR